MLSVIITKAVAMTVAVMPAGEVTPIAAVAWFMAIISYCSAPITDSLIQGMASPSQGIIMPMPMTMGIEGTIENMALLKTALRTTSFFIPICLARLTALNKNINDIAKMAVTIKPPSKKITHSFLYT